MDYFYVLTAAVTRQSIEKLETASLQQSVKNDASHDRMKEMNKR
jgi:hypothetical protein